jgi:nicotinamide-nucleotide amidase
MRPALDPCMRQFASDPPVERRVGEALRAAGESVATAESVTGGLVGALLTAEPGASDYFLQGTTTYAYDSKRRLLGVDRETLDEHGAVAAPTVRAMARRARDLADADWGVATVGVAGPGGGTAETPVGTAFVGVARAAPWENGDSYARTERHAFDGDRAAVRERTARAALTALEAALADDDR